MIITHGFEDMQFVLVYCLLTIVYIVYKDNKLTLVNKIDLKKTDSE